MNKVAKTILKFLLVFIVFFIICVLFSIIRKSIIFNYLYSISKENSNNNNYTYSITVYNKNEKTYANTIAKILNNKFLITMDKKVGNNIIKSIIYSDESDKIGIYQENETKMYTVNGVNSGNLTIAGNAHKLNDMNFISYYELRKLENIINSKITIEKCNKKQCYFIQLKDKIKIWIDKNTGIVVREIVNDVITDYEYEINNVKEQEIIKPSI